MKLESRAIRSITKPSHEHKCGICPCSIDNKENDTFENSCPCDDFTLKGKCRCGIFKEYEE